MENSNLLLGSVHDHDLVLAVTQVVVLGIGKSVVNDVINALQGLNLHKNTLETGEEDGTTHSKRVKKMEQHTRNE